MSLKVGPLAFGLLLLPPSFPCLLLTFSLLISLFRWVFSFWFCGECLAERYLERRRDNVLLPILAFLLFNFFLSLSFFSWFGRELDLVWGSVSFLFFLFLVWPRGSLVGGVLCFVFPFLFVVLIQFSKYHLLPIFHLSILVSLYWQNHGFWVVFVDLFQAMLAGHVRLFGFLEKPTKLLKEA